MATEGESKKRRVRKIETVRERTEKTSIDNARPKRMRKTARTAAKPFKAAASLARREYYMPMPDNKAGRFLNKRRRFIPRYFRESWTELKLVTWPSNRETLKLTLAVFVFAIVFGTIIAITDYGLDKLFRRILLS